MSDSTDNTNITSESVKSDKHNTSSRSKNKKAMALKTLEEQRRKNDTLYQNDFYMSPWLILGFFIAAIGFGFLIPTGVQGLSFPAYQTWSVILFGLPIGFFGLYQTIKKNRELKAKKSSTKKK